MDPLSAILVGLSVGALLSVFDKIRVSTRGERAFAMVLGRQPDATKAHLRELRARLILDPHDPEVIHEAAKAIHRILLAENMPSREVLEAIAQPSNRARSYFIEKLLNNANLDAPSRNPVHADAGAPRSPVEQRPE